MHEASRKTVELCVCVPSFRWGRPCASSRSVFYHREVRSYDMKNIRQIMPIMHNCRMFLSYIISSIRKTICSLDNPNRFSMPPKAHNPQRLVSSSTL